MHDRRQPIPYREQERDAITQSLLQTRNIHIYGRRGQGKNHTATTAANNSDTPYAYVDCTQHRTTTQLLTKIYNSLTDQPLQKRVHLDQLKTDLASLLTPNNAVILDDIDFAKHPDSVLTWLNTQTPATIATISSNTGDLTTLTDKQTVSRLQPFHIHFKEYRRTELTALLHREADRHGINATENAVRYITQHTSNMNYAEQWLHTAHDYAEDAVTESLTAQTQSEARIRYENQLLSKVSKHHHIVLEAINELTDPVDTTVTTVTVYSHYEDICEVLEEEPRTHRRVTIYIDHLDLLGIVDVATHNGGSQGKTREIKLQEL